MYPLTRGVLLVSVTLSLAGSGRTEGTRTADHEDNWLWVPPRAHIQPLPVTLSKKMARTTTDDDNDVTTAPGVGGSSTVAVRKIVEDEESLCDDEGEKQSDERTLTLKQMALDKGLSIQGRSSNTEEPVPQCDQFIIALDFYIHSPNYPANYAANTTCKYQIYRRHPDYCGVVFTVLRLDLATRLGPHNDTNEILKEVGGAVGVEGRRECPGDTLVINGVTHCGRYQRGKTATFVFPSSLMTVEFQSGASHGASGFLLQGQQVKTCRRPRTLGAALVSSVPCDRRVEGESFKLRSPEYPRQYEHNLECRYTVVRGGDQFCGVKLQVEDFRLEDGSCMFDYLEVQSQRFCGSLLPGFTRYYEFEGEELIIRFRTDESTKKKGFSLVGELVACGEPLPVQSPLNQSPPGRVEDDQSPPSSGPSTQSPVILTPPSVTPSLNNLSEIDISYILSVIGRRPLPTDDNGASGRGVPEESFTELGPGLTTEEELGPGLTTEGEELDPGLTTEEEFHPGLTTEEEFHPGFTTEEELDLGLTTEEETSDSELVTGGEVDPGLVTEGDDEDTNSDQNIPGNPDFNPFTGTGLQPTLPTFPNGFPTTVNFPATSSFPTTIFPTVRTSDCDLVLSASNFVISSPNYPTDYPNNKDCSYILQVTFVDLDLPTRDTNTGECTGDYLDVDGTRFCGSFKGSLLTFNFTDNTLSLAFHSDGSTSGRGFRIQGKQVTEGCGGVLPVECNATTQMTQFTLISPGYPSTYPASVDCVTTVSRATPDVTNVVLEMVAFETSSTPGCTGDYLEVGGQRLCGQLTGQTRNFMFSSNSLTITFHSDSTTSSGDRGYQVRVTQRTSINPGGCGGFVTTSTASLQSPGYPSQYQPNLDCRYIVTKVSRDVCQLHVKVRRDGEA
ncbi:Cubilin-like 8 [Homarus americanus]|uniref:Cubilin-like 8 n=1 Tax=Homarus americanus TaxID=6706 RepID=A0A8J5JSH8_HOMAM|nr:Cubilin-like 8 [Homarus americanus]